MKGAIVVCFSLLSSCIPGSLAAALPADKATRDVILGTPVQVLDGQQVWSDDQSVGNVTDPTPVLDERQVLRPTAWTSAEGKFSRDMLKITNQYRAIHGAPPVVWDKKLASFAVTQAKKCNFAHSGGPYGENLAGGGPMSNPVWYQWLWYKERANYNWNKPGFSTTTGHFTQLVWKSTRQMGCAWVAGCPNLSFQVWCEYWPRGNVAPANPHYINNVGRASRGIPAAPPTVDPYYH